MSSSHRTGCKLPSIFLIAYGPSEQMMAGNGVLRRGSLFWWEIQSRLFDRFRGPNVTAYEDAVQQ